MKATQAAEAASSQVTDAMIGERVHMLMFRQRVTQTALAARLGMTQASLSRKLRGEIRWFATELIAVAPMLGTTLDELCAVRDSNPEPADLESEDDLNGCELARLTACQVIAGPWAAVAS